jgi:hypothetical protein
MNNFLVGQHQSTSFLKAGAQLSVIPGSIKIERKVMAFATLLIRILFVGFLTLLCVPASAFDFYDIEILVFRQFNSQNDDEELDIPNFRHLELNLELQDLFDRKEAIPLEPAIEGYLSQPAQLINVSPDYEILFHGRWSQISSDRKAAPYIQIDLPAIGRSHTLTGVLRLFSTDLLYFDTFLRYRPAKKPTTEQTSEPEGQQPYYFLKERRRVKFREVHFLDHPKFGVLLTVWPVKLPELPPSTIKPQPEIKVEPTNAPAILPSSNDS